MKHYALIIAAGLALTACSEPAADTAAQDTAMDHGAMDHAAPAQSADAAAPLPDDGIMPVVEISDAWIRPHPQGRDVTAAYFTATLSQGHADRLVEARMDGAGHIELHTHTMNDEGMMQMRQVGPQDITDAGALAFAPGGLHLMVFGMDPVAEGDAVTGTLVFERAGEVAVTFQARNTAPGGHSGH